MHRPPPFLRDVEAKEDETWVGAMAFVENPQSHGTVTLQSKDPKDKPLFDPKILTHPFDRRVIIEGIRENIKFLKAPVYASDTLRFYGPKGDTDEEIWVSCSFERWCLEWRLTDFALQEYVKGNVATSWHMSCTARMGTSPEEACVDSDFRVFGLDALRIVDMSVAPFTPR